MSTKVRALDPRPRLLNASAARTTVVGLHNAAIKAKESGRGLTFYGVLLLALGLMLCGALVAFVPGLSSSSLTEVGRTWRLSSAQRRESSETTPRPMENEEADLVKLAEVDPAKLRAFAAELDPEMMAAAPPHPPAWDEAVSKLNPCWHAGGKLRCLPGLVLMGNFHTGATALTAKLLRHPNIVADSSSFNQFWAEDGKTTQEYLEGLKSAMAAVLGVPNKPMIIFDGSQSTFPFYVANSGKTHRVFSKVIQECHRNCTEGPTGPAPDVDACMGSNCFPSAMKADVEVAERHGFSYDDQHVPLLMRAMYGDRPPRLVVVLRDPTERLHSAYYGYPHYRDKYGPNPEGFLAFVKEQVGAFEHCRAKHSDAECVLHFERLGTDEEKVYFHCDQVLRGTYSVYMERWLRWLPRDHLLAIKAEHYFANEVETLQRIVEHAGLPAPDDAMLDSMLNVGSPNQYGTGREMLPEARKLLSDFYRPFNERLAALLKDPYYAKQWSLPDGPVWQPAAGEAAAAGAPTEAAANRHLLGRKDGGVLA